MRYLDRDKASKEADRVSEETIAASEEARKGGGGGNMEEEKKKGEEETIAGFLLQVGREQGRGIFLEEERELSV